METLYWATALLDLVAMSVSLWMAFYLFARGFPSWITLRVVIVLAALAVFFFGAYHNFFHQIVGSAAWRAVLVVIGQVTWYSLTYQLMTPQGQKKYRWMWIGLLTLALVSGVVLWVNGNAFYGEKGNILFVEHMQRGVPYTLYGIFQVLVVFGTMFNLLVDNKIGLTSQGKYFLIVSIFPIVGVAYGIYSLASPVPMPRIIQDGLIFCSVFFFGLSVVRHQTLVERRTTMQDFPVSAISVLGLSAIYGYCAAWLGFSPQAIGIVVGMAVVTHSLYDLAREFLERLRAGREGHFRRQLRQLESDNVSAEHLNLHLQEGLDLLCHTLKTPTGFIAVRRGDDFVVMAERRSLDVGAVLPRFDLPLDDLIHPEAELIPNIAWYAPAFEGQSKVAIVGIGKPRGTPDHSSGNLDLLAEFTDRVGVIVSIQNTRPEKTEQIQQLVSAIDADSREMHSTHQDLLAATVADLDQDFLKMVEEALRHFSDTIQLGQSALADWVGVEGASHVERGKRLQNAIREAIEALRPEGARPPEPLPRLWYNFVVLHDAYIEGVLNREIMARLYISEGTFNRTRRNALRGLARLLLEQYRRAPSAK